MPHSLRKKYEHKIQQVVASGFERNLLAAAFDNLKKKGPLRINNFSYALRELLRHVLHRLATEEQVKACSWFTPNKNTNGKITRAQRITYAIQGGLSNYYVTEKLGIDIETARKQLLDAIEVLNNYTHIQPSTIGINKTEARRIANECLGATLYFVEHVSMCRTQVAEALATHIDRVLLNHVLSETIDSVDELATHHSIDEIYVDTIDVIDIGPRAIELAIYGTIGCELQYGSNSDVRNDIGAVMSTAFPLNAQMTVQLVKPLGKVCDLRKFTVDTSGWYE